MYKGQWRIRYNINTCTIRMQYVKTTVITIHTVNVKNNFCCFNSHKQINSSSAVVSQLHGKILYRMQVTAKMNPLHSRSVVNLKLWGEKYWWAKGLYYLFNNFNQILTAWLINVCQWLTMNDLFGVVSGWNLEIPLWLWLTIIFISMLILRLRHKDVKGT